MITGFVGHIVYYGIGLIMICIVITTCSMLLWATRIFNSMGKLNKDDKDS